MRSIALNPVLAYKVKKIALEKKMSNIEALSFLVKKVCTPRSILPKNVYTPNPQPAAK